MHTSLTATPATLCRRQLLAAAIGMLGLAASAGAQETTPNKPIKFIVPYPAGAGNDILARMVGQKMSE